MRSPLPAHSHLPPKADDRRSDPVLTPRQRQALALVSEGKNDQDIALNLNAPWPR